MVVLAALTEPAPPSPLRCEVARRTARWALEIGGPGLAFGSSVRDGLGDLRPFDEPHAEDLPATLAGLLVGHRGPVILVGADVPRLDRALAAAVLEDLRTGCALSFAPATDGRPFLLGLRAPEPDLLALVAGRHRDEVLAAALALDGEVGMLRSERRVVTTADARALSLDPLVPEPLRTLAAAG